MTPSVTGFAPEVADEIGYVLDHLNGHHADSVAFVATRHLDADAPAPPSETAAFATLDRAGFDVLVGDTATGRRIRIPFSTEVTSLDELRTELLTLLSSARAAAPTAPITSIEEELATSDERVAVAGPIVAARRLSGNLRELTVGGQHDFPGEGGDQWFTLVVPHPDAALPRRPTFTALTSLPEGQQPAMATYTVRRWRRELGEVDIWLVLHDHDGAVSGWARSAEVGERVALLAGRRSFTVPPDATSLLLVADETGLAAVAAYLDELPSTLPTQVVAEVVDAEHVVDLPQRTNVAVQWVFRDGAEPGTSLGLIDAVRGLDLPVDGLCAFGAAESCQISAVRRYLRHELGAPATQVQMTGYWRRASATVTT